MSDLNTILFGVAAFIFIVVSAASLVVLAYGAMILRDIRKTFKKGEEMMARLEETEKKAQEDGERSVLGEALHFGTILLERRKRKKVVDK